MNEGRSPCSDCGPVVEEQSGENAGNGTGNHGNNKIPFSLNVPAFLLGFAFGLLLTLVVLEVLTNFL